MPRPRHRGAVNRIDSVRTVKWVYQIQATVLEVFGIASGNGEPLSFGNSRNLTIKVAHRATLLLSVTSYLSIDTRGIFIKRKNPRLEGGCKETLEPIGEQSPTPAVRHHPQAEANLRNRNSSEIEMVDILGVEPSRYRLRWWGCHKL